MKIKEILNKKEFTKEELVFLLGTEGEEMELLLEKAHEVKLMEIGNYVWLRGLIEYSNVCTKSCLYCGVRCNNTAVPRYTLSDEEVLESARLAMDMELGSIAIQSGERFDNAFIDKIEYLVREIKKLSSGELGITLSCGEQTLETYKKWFDAGAHRYLLRIESSDQDLYYKIHPKDRLHSYERRLKGILDLKEAGYQAGSGVMIGLPFQTLDILAEDLLFLKQIGVVMVGMGPFIPHNQTPLYEYADDLIPEKERMDLTLKMIACLRLIMPRINMVAATACQTLDKKGREKAVMAGANIIMPNLTPLQYRENYLIYPDKQNVKDKPSDTRANLVNEMSSINHIVRFGQWGDAKAFFED